MIDYRYISFFDFSPNLCSSVTQRTPTKSDVCDGDLMGFNTPAQPPRSVKKRSTQKKAKEILGSFFLTPARRSARLSLSQTPNYQN